MESVRPALDVLLNPDSVGSVRRAWLGREVTKGREELLHLFLQHSVTLLGVVLGALGVAQLDLHHGVLLTLLLQLVVEVHQLRLQLGVTQLQTAERETERAY